MDLIAKIAEHDPQLAEELLRLKNEIDLAQAGK
jgi:hypothetical protein